MMNWLWVQGEGGHMGNPWDLACLQCPSQGLTRRGRGSGGRQAVVGKDYTLCVPPALIWFSSVFFPSSA